MIGMPLSREQAMGCDPDFPGQRESRSARTLRLALIIGLHAVLIGTALTATVRPQFTQLAQELEVRLIESQPPEPPAARPEPPWPLPRKALPVARPEAVPPPVTTAAPEAPAPAGGFSVPPQPAPAPVEAGPAPPAPPAVTGARFDADYLHNPAPAYPVMSRRLGEQGRVVLNVRVLADGMPGKVEVRTSSGFPRLDQAALEAVGRWRFVPARRGEEPVAAWVLVPVNFSLDR
jgi:protein TonB